MNIFLNCMNEICIKDRCFKCLRSERWNQRYTLCVMVLVGCTSMSANNACWYQVLEDLTFNKEAPPEFLWTNFEQSLAKASYFIGFLSSSIPGCLLVIYFGGKVIFWIGCTCSGIGTILTPIIIKSFGVIGIVILRIIIGAGEGMVIPAGLTLVSKWVPSQDRGLMVGLFLTAPQLGLLVGNLSSGYIIDLSNWPASLYTWGTICLIYSTLFFFICYSAPPYHPFISDKELKFLLEKVPNVKEEKISVVLKNIIKSVRAWCVIISAFGFNWCFFSSFVMDFPKYTNRILGIEIEERGAVMSIPFTLMYATSLPCCYIADFVLQRRVVKRWVMRKVCACLSSIPPAALVVAAYYCGARCPAATLCLFALTLVFMSFYFCGLQINSLSLSPHNLTLFIAVINTFGGLSAIMAPIIHAFITASNDKYDWRIVGWICSALLASGIILYYCCGSAAKLRWDGQTSDDEYNYKMNVRIRLKDPKRVSEQVEEQVAKLINEGSLELKKDERTSRKGILKKDGNELMQKDSKESKTKGLSTVSEALKDDYDNDDDEDNDDEGTKQKGKDTEQQHSEEREGS